MCHTDFYCQSCMCIRLAKKEHPRKRAPEKLEAAAARAPVIAHFLSLSSSALVIVAVWSPPALEGHESSCARTTQSILLDLAVSPQPTGHENQKQQTKQHQM